MRTIISFLPGIYRNFLPDFFSKEVNNESIATCHDCIMTNDNDDSGNMNYYLKKTKCCTFFPFIPNYMAGLILKSGSEEGKENLRKLITAGHGVSPFGIEPGKKYKLEFQISREKAFGQNLSLKCPYLDKDANCSVWEARGATCATYFCRNIRGLDGEEFWNTVKNLLKTAEEKLARYAVLETEPSLAKTMHKPSSIFDFRANDLDGLPDSDYSNIWGKWETREENFYLKCYEKASAVSKSDFVNIMGIDLSFSMQEIESAYNNMMFPELPERLKLNPAAGIKPISNKCFQINVYSGSFQIPADFFKMLCLFDGSKSVSETIEIISKELETEIEEDLLINLYQNRVLIEL